MINLKKIGIKIGIWTAAIPMILLIGSVFVFSFIFSCLEILEGFAVLLLALLLACIIGHFENHD